MEAHMELDDTIARVKQLIAQREQIDAELVALFAGASPSKRKIQTCSTCGQEGHSSRTCPQKPQE